MKIINLTLSMFICFTLTAQEKFKYDENGLTPKYLVGEINGLNKNKVYEKSLNWIKETYKNPDEVIKTTIENEKIRFQGVAMDYLCQTVLLSTFCYNTTYTIELEFRNGKYKFTPTSISYRMPASQYDSGGSIEVNLNNGLAFYKKNGTIRKQTKSMPESIEKLFNDLERSLKEYVEKDDSNEKW
ncbi:MAG: DUF4468 domain-containing protein [Vicingaceae bacterium]|nr:DUF4468 domain-containing protein [Vicingaceae bacterium]